MSPGHVPRAGSAGAAPGPVASSQLFRRPTLLWGADNLAARARATTPWLWHGYLAPGTLTLLVGRCHAGKTPTRLAKLPQARYEDTKALELAILGQE
jgi:hypothetical protein